jgi:hypothetical protein
MVHPFFSRFFSLFAMASRIHVTRSSSPRAWSTPSAISSLSGSVIRTGYSFFLPMLNFFVCTILTTTKTYRMYVSSARGKHMTNIRWNGDFANEAKSGQIVEQNGALLTIKWEDGKQQVIPEFVTKGQGWTRS